MHEGGFKVVYRAVVRGKTEALKLVKIPKTQNTAEAEAFRKEMIGRVRREIEALGKCQRPEIVRLGQIPATDIVIQNEDYIAYTEEFLEGKNLGEIIAAKEAKPDEKELRTLFVSLLVAIKELWGHGYSHAFSRSSRRRGGLPRLVVESSRVFTGPIFPFGGGRAIANPTLSLCGTSQPDNLFRTECCPQPPLAGNSQRFASR